MRTAATPVDETRSRVVEAGLKPAPPNIIMDYLYNWFHFKGIVV
jgi:hypothetical protein